MTSTAHRLAGLTLAGVAVLALATPASASSSGKVQLLAKHYANCTALVKDYPHGVSKNEPDEEAVERPRRDRQAGRTPGDLHREQGLARPRQGLHRLRALSTNSWPCRPVRGELAG